jgi:hypothetical protein
MILLEKVSQKLHDTFRKSIAKIKYVWKNKICLEKLHINY